MYWVNPIAGPGTGTVSRILFAIVGKWWLNAWDYRKSSKYNLLLKNNDLVFNFVCCFWNSYFLLLFTFALRLFIFSKKLWLKSFLRINFNYLSYFWKNYIRASTFNSVCIGWNSDAFLFARINGRYNPRLQLIFDRYHYLFSGYALIITGKKLFVKHCRTRTDVRLSQYIW